MLFDFSKKNATKSIKLRAYFCHVKYSKISASPQAPHGVSFLSSSQECALIDWLQSLKQFFISMCHIIYL